MELSEVKYFSLKLVIYKKNPIELGVGLFPPLKNTDIFYLFIFPIFCTYFHSDKTRTKFYADKLSPNSVSTCKCAKIGQKN